MPFDKEDRKDLLKLLVDLLEGFEKLPPRGGVDLPDRLAEVFSRLLEVLPLLLLELQALLEFLVIAYAARLTGPID